MEAILLPPLVAQLGREAPQARIVLRAIDQSYDYASALERDELDMEVCNWPGAPQHLRTAHLRIEETVCLMAADHPLAGRARLSIEDNLAAAHLARWRGRNPTPDPSIRNWPSGSCATTSASWCPNST